MGKIVVFPQNISACNLSVIGVNDEPVHRVIKLPYVSRPHMFQKTKLRFFRKRLARAIFFVVFFEKYISQRNDVFASFAERRYFYRKYCEAVIEIFPEFSVLNHLNKISVGGCQYSYIHSYRLSTAHRVKLAFLYDSQQFRLKFQRHFPYFVQQQHSAVCNRKIPFLSAFLCAGKRTFLIAEKLRLHKFFRNCRAVDFYKRPVLA